MRIRLTSLAVLAAVAACSPQSPTPAAQTSPEAATATRAVSEQIDSTKTAIARADALLEDMRHKQQAFEQAERTRASTPHVNAYSAPPDTALAPPSARAVASSLAPAAAPAVAEAFTFGGHDERWWKDQMRDAQIRLTDNIRRLQEANDQRGMALRQMDAAVGASPIMFAETQKAVYASNAEVRRLEAEVRNDSAAVERLREDARRADVPPGWLRWP